jgi:L-lysine 2,3-aminomutase
VRDYNKKWYDNNPTRREYLGKQKTAQVKRNNAAVLAYLENHPCVDCGEADPIVLEFDHGDGGGKVAAVCFGIQHGWSIAKLMTEIAKCDVRCANCHRRKTARERSYFRAGL